MSKRIFPAIAALLAIGAASAGCWYFRQALEKPDFPAVAGLTDLTGAPHSVADYRGKLVLVNFWATWCGPCLEEMPDLIKAQTQYGPHGFQVLGIAADDPAAVRKTAADLGIDYPVLTGSIEDVTGLMRTLGNDAGVLPFSVWVDKKGQIVGQTLGALGMTDVAQMSDQYLGK